MSLTRKSIPNLDTNEMTKRQKIESMMSAYYSENLKISLKVDGFSFRIGRELDGRPFVATARSGRIYFPGDFTEYTKSLENVTEDQLQRSGHYDKLAEFVLDSDLVECIPPGVVQWCEMIYVPMCKVVDGKVRQVSVWYDQDKLGSVLTVVPFKVTREPTVEPMKINLCSRDERIKVTNPEIDIIEQSWYSDFFEDLNLPDDSATEDMVTILHQRKKIYRHFQEVYMKTIDQRLTWFRGYLTDIIWGRNWQNIHQLGPNVEGVVVTCSNGHQFKFVGV